MHRVDDVNDGGCGYVGDGVVGCGAGDVVGYWWWSEGDGKGAVARCLAAEGCAPGNVV